MCLCLDVEIMADTMGIYEVRWLDIISNFEDRLVRLVIEVDHGGNIRCWGLYTS